MHVVMGGAFNGKSEWVNEYYGHEGAKVLVNCEQRSILDIFEKTNSRLLVFQSVHYLVKAWLENMTDDQVRRSGRAWIEAALAWEEASPQRQLVVIGTDFSKGIVPMSGQMRRWRDTTGWFYQDLIKEAEIVHQIWYGLSRKLK